MMYLGGKNRSGKKFSKELINPILKATGFNYVEPFVGSGGVFKNIETDRPKYINDYHYFVYAFHKGIKDGYKFEEFYYNDYYGDFQELYNRLKEKYAKDINLKNADTLPDCLIGYIGFQCAYDTDGLNEAVGSRVFKKSGCKKGEK